MLVFVFNYNFLINNLFLVCFKIFDMDRDCYLNAEELSHMVQTLLFVAKENNANGACLGTVEEEAHAKIMTSLSGRLDQNGGLTQEEFLVWGVEENGVVEPLLELLRQVCHVSFVLKPHCRHHEHDIGILYLFFY